MKVLGPALITTVQQHALATGVDVVIPRTAVYPSAAKRARIGDLFWVREPYQEYVTKSGYFLGIARGYGPRAHVSKELRRRLPFRVSGGQQINDYRWTQLTGEFLTRRNSWTSLEIVAALGGDGWRCKAIMKQIDLLLAERSCHEA